VLSRRFKEWSAALVVAVLLAGCGGSRGDVATRERFIIAGDSMCSRFPPPLGRFLAGGGGGGNLVTGINRFAGRIERFVTDIERLELPSGRQRLAASRFVGSIKRLAPAVSRLRIATARLGATSPTDADSVGRAISRVGQIGQQFDRLVGEAGVLAQAYGFKECDIVLRAQTAADPSPGAPVTDPLRKVLPPAGASGAARRQFLSGRAVAAQSGCLACHRLARQGNSGPGRPLDEIGARASRAAIVRALRNPVAPMPSYGDIPSAKFDALVGFLVGLRSRAP